MKDEGWLKKEEEGKKIEEEEWKMEDEGQRKGNYKESQIDTG